MGHRIKILKDFISEHDANLIISIIKNSSLEYFVDNPDVKVVPNSNLTAENILKKYSDKLLSIHKKEFGFARPIYTVQGHASLWETGAHALSHTDSHSGCEHVITTSILYLGGSFSGGSIVFPNQNFEYFPEPLSAVIFPSGGMEYLHEVKQITYGERYTIAMWHSGDRYFSLGEKYLREGNHELARLWATRLAWTEPRVNISSR